MTHYMEMLPKKFGRQALHAYKIKFVHPIINLQVIYEASIPDDIEKKIKRQ